MGTLLHPPLYSRYTCCECIVYASKQYEGKTFERYASKCFVQTTDPQTQQF